jgi:hypothetical protein
MERYQPGHEPAYYRRNRGMRGLLNSHINPWDIRGHATPPSPPLFLHGHPLFCLPHSIQCGMCLFGGLKGVTDRSR